MAQNTFAQGLLCAPSSVREGAILDLVALYWSCDTSMGLLGLCPTEADAGAVLLRHREVRRQSALRPVALVDRDGVGAVVACSAVNQ